MTDYTPLQSYGQESRERITMPALPWASATQPEPIRRAMMETKADKLVLRAESDNARRPVKPDADPSELWFAIRSQEAAKRDGHSGAVPKAAMQVREGGTMWLAPLQGEMLAALRSRGRATSRQLADATGRDVDNVSAALIKLARKGFIRCIGTTTQPGKSGPVKVYEVTDAQA